MALDVLGYREGGTRHGYGIEMDIHEAGASFDTRPSPGGGEKIYKMKKKIKEEKEELKKEEEEEKKIKRKEIER